MALLDKLAGTVAVLQATLATRDHSTEETGSSCSGSDSDEHCSLRPPRTRSMPDLQLVSAGRRTTTQYSLADVGSNERSQLG